MESEEQENDKNNVTLIRAATQKLCEELNELLRAGELDKIGVIVMRLFSIRSTYIDV